jgi:energy-coupling factor transport system ATP-binding protein
MAEQLIRMGNASWQYEDSKKNALGDINFSLDEGDFVGVIGPNAAGKSSLCRLCNGLIPHSFEGNLTGRVTVCGRDVRDTKTAELATMVGFVFSDPEAQLSQISVFDEIAFGCCNLEIPRKEIIKRVEKVMESLHIEHMQARSPFTLSGGEQQRVAIASVLAMEPKILVLDEPTSNLDPVGTEDIFRAVAALNREKGMTVLMVEHEIELLAEYANRIILMDKGSIRLNGSPQDVYKEVDVFTEAGMNIPQITEIAILMDRKYHSWKGGPYPLTLKDGIRDFSLPEGNSGLRLPRIQEGE